MVMMEKNLEDTRSTKRLRTDSPRRDDADSGENCPAAGDRIDAGMCRIGEEYQASVDDFITDNVNETKHEALLVWCPPETIPDAQVDEFCNIAKQKHKYNQEQALGMLFWHRHNIDSALGDLANFTPFPDDWSVEDKVLFEQGFSFHGKSFHRIRQLLPDKSIASLVKYYYNWKKTRSRSSLMDRQARKLAVTTTGGGARTGGNSTEDSSDASDSEDADVMSEDRKVACTNCGEKRQLQAHQQLHVIDKGAMCSPCYQHWRRTGLPPRSSATASVGAVASSKKDHETGAAIHSAGDQDSSHQQRGGRRPPRGIHLHQDDLLAFAAGPITQGEGLLKLVEEELASLKAQVQSNKQHISIHKSHILESVTEYKTATDSLQRIVNRWTNDELLLAVQGIRKYGKDFKAIAEVIGTKLESHVCSFFTTYRRTYNLDEILEEYETESGLEHKSEAPTDMDGDRRKQEMLPKSTFQAGMHPPPLVRQASSSPQKMQRATSAVKLLSQPPPPPLVKAKQGSALQA